MDPPVGRAAGPASPQLPGTRFLVVVADIADIGRASADIGRASADIERASVRVSADIAPDRLPDCLQSASASAASVAPRRLVPPLEGSD